MTPLRRRRTDPLAGSLDPVYPQPSNAQAEVSARPVDDSWAEPSGHLDEAPPAPSAVRRVGRAVDDVRRRIIPLPDEIVDDFLATGEVVIHSDHPSFRSFVVDNVWLWLGFVLVSAAFLGIAFDGSFASSAVVLIVLTAVLLVLVIKRLEERYTTYVVTDSRIMRLHGILSRHAQSIPWVRVTDLAVDQSLGGRIFGYASFEIMSANEESGLRKLKGVSDPLQFAKHVTDMVVAKQGATQPAWAVEGLAPPPQTQRGLRRVRLSRRRGDGVLVETSPGSGATGAGSSASAPRRPSRVRIPPSGDTRGSSPGSGTSAPDDDLSYDGPYDADVEVDLDPDDLASEIRSADEHDLPWRDNY